MSDSRIYSEWVTEGRHPGIAPPDYPSWPQEKRNEWCAKEYRREQQQSKPGGLHGKTSPAQRFELIPFDKISLDSTPRYLVKGLIPRTGLTIIWGPPKCGKSFFAFDLAMHIALGWDYCGRRVRQGPVVYCAPEGAEGFRARIEAFRQAKMAEASGSVPFHLVASPMTLAKDHTALIAATRAAHGQTMPAAIFIDTLNRSIGGSESDDRDMAAYVHAADAIRDAFKCAVIIVHHCGIDATRPRGHTSLTGAADAQLAVKRDAGDNIIIGVEYMKDGPVGEELALRLEAIEVGKDSDGDPITSCVVVPAKAARAALTKRRPRLPDCAANVLSALKYAIDEVGAVPPGSNHIPADIKTVTLNQARQYFDLRTHLDKPDSRLKGFNRGMDKLTALGTVVISNDYVWIA
jgi:hypothetical protein